MNNDEEDAGSRKEPDAGPVRTQMCGDVNCGLHGDCMLSANGSGSCTCDHGYVAMPDHPDADEGVCVEDLTCVTARMLECRTGIQTAGVSMHFSLQYCSGRPYTDLKQSDLIVEEQGNTGVFEEPLENEAYVSIVPYDPLMHVYVAVDVSNSIQDSKVLDDVRDALKHFIDDLVDIGGDYRFAVFLFDGSDFLTRYIVDTSDLADARDQLDGFERAEAMDPSSSNVFGAVIEGINQLERAMSLRNLVYDLGTVNTGTLIVVSDGDDRAGVRTLEDVMTMIAGTPNNVLTVGLGDVANYPTLSSIGRDGSFSATTPSLVEAAFEQIADRIREQRDSLYLLGYCSPKREGPFISRIGIRGFELDRPTCGFDASSFAGGSCDANNFKRDVACDGVECGGVIGCGDCGDGQCCDGGQCMGPTKVPEKGQCGSVWMCESITTCDDGECKLTVAEGSECSGANLCEAGVTECRVPDPDAEPPLPPKTCFATLEEGFVCENSEACTTLTCGPPPNQPGSTVRICLPRTQMFHDCKDNPDGCEPGSYCDGKVCLKQYNAGTCKKNSECKTGHCVMTGGSGTSKSCRHVDTDGLACTFALEL